MGMFHVEKGKAEKRVIAFEALDEKCINAFTFLQYSMRSAGPSALSIIPSEKLLIQSSVF